MNWKQTWLSLEKLSETAALEKMDLKYDSVLGTQMGWIIREEQN